MLLSFLRYLDPGRDYRFNWTYHDAKVTANALTGFLEDAINLKEEKSERQLSEQLFYKSDQSELANDGSKQHICVEKEKSFH